jgi:hypothetical protein
MICRSPLTLVACGSWEIYRMSRSLLPVLGNQAVHAVVRVRRSDTCTTFGVSANVVERPRHMRPLALRALKPRLTTHAARSACQKCDRYGNAWESDRQRDYPNQY